MTVLIQNVQYPYHNHLQSAYPVTMKGMTMKDDSPRWDSSKLESTPNSSSSSAPPLSVATLSVSRHTTNTSKMMSCDDLREELQQLRAQGHESNRRRNEEVNILDRVLVDKLTTLNTLLSRQQQSSLCPSFWEYAQTIRGAFDGRPSPMAGDPKVDAGSVRIALSDSATIAGSSGGSSYDDHDGDDDGITPNASRSTTTSPPTAVTSTLKATEGRSSYTWYGWCEAWLLRSLHHAMNWKKQLDRVRADSNAQILFLYQQIESIQGEESDVETRYFKLIHKANQRNSIRRKLWQHYLHVQESIIHKIQRWEQQQQQQQQQYQPGGQRSYEGFDQ